MNITAVVTGKKTESQLDQDRSAMEEHDEGIKINFLCIIEYCLFNPILHMCTDFDLRK